MGVKSVSERVPGHNGYALLASRADSERLVRRYLISRLLRARDRLAELTVDLWAHSDPAAREIDRAVLEIQLMIDTIKSFEAGDGAWRTRPSLREEDLEAMQVIDLNLLDGVGRIADAVATIVRGLTPGSNAASPPPGVGELIRTLDALSVAFQRRVAIIKDPLP